MTKWKNDKMTKNEKMIKNDKKWQKMTKMIKKWQKWQKIFFSKKKNCPKRISQKIYQKLPKTQEKTKCWPTNQPTDIVAYRVA